MNKRIRNKIAKRKALEALEKKDVHSVQPTVPMQSAARTPVDEPVEQPSSLTARVASEIGTVAEATKTVLEHAAHGVTEQAKQAALALEKKAEQLLEKVPIVGDVAARGLHKLADKST